MFTVVKPKQINRILEETAEHYECSVDDLRGPSHIKIFTEARQLACFLAWRAGYTNSEFGRLINRDHSTVLHSIRMTRRRLYLLSDTVREIETRVQAGGFQQPGHWRKVRIEERSAGA